MYHLKESTGFGKHENLVVNASVRLICMKGSADASILHSCNEKRILKSCLKRLQERAGKKETVKKLDYECSYLKIFHEHSFVNQDKCNPPWKAFDSF